MNYKETFETYCKNYMKGQKFEKPAHYADTEWQVKKKSELAEKIKKINDDLLKQAKIIQDQAGEDQDSNENNLATEFNQIIRKHLVEFEEKHGQ